jgi:ferritin-like metal-binding protein YciE
MSLFNWTELKTLEDLFLVQIEDLYDAEQRLVDALPKMAEAAHCSDLKSAFQTHWTETKGHVGRLERIFKKLGKTPTRETCPAMKGLIAEGDEMAGASGDPSVKDAALIAAAQRVEHYEMAAYGTVRTLARHLGRDDIAEELQKTLDEEGNADKILTEIAESAVNVRAEHA